VLGGKEVLDKYEVVEITMSIFIKIAKKYNWKLKGEPIRLNGGFMHKMYKIDTEQGAYALKLLNPFVMQRKTAMANYAKAEQIDCRNDEKEIGIAQVEETVHGFY